MPYSLSEGHDADEDYISDIPDLVICSAFGTTPAEALTELEELVYELYGLTDEEVAIVEGG